MIFTSLLPNLITETEISMTFQTPDDAFISGVDGAVATIGESRRGAYIPNKSLANSKPKVKAACWHVRTSSSVVKTAHITAGMTLWGIDKHELIKL